MKKYRKDINKMGAAMKMVRNPRDWTPPGQEKTPAERAKVDLVTPTNNGFTKEKLEKYNKTAENHIQKAHEKWKRDQFYKGYGGIEMTSNPIEWFIGGGGIKAATNTAKKGFNLVKGLVKDQIKKPSNIKKVKNYGKGVGGRALGDIAGDKLGL